MDNASKALIMVGAILIAVMLISLGVYLFTYAREQAEGTTDIMDGMTASAFNQQFIDYCGPKVSASRTKSFIALVQSAQGGKHKVTLNRDGITSAGSVETGATYKIEDVTYGGDGYLTVVKVTKNTSSTSST